MKQKYINFKKNNHSKKKHLQSIIVVLFILLSHQINFSQTIVERYGRLQVNNGHVTAENGEKVSLAGNSLFWSNAGDTADYYNAESVNHLADDWRSAIIRPALGVKENWDGGTGYIDNPQVQMAKIKKVIDAAIAKGVYVIVDWHTHAAEQYTNEATIFFETIAELYGDYDNVIYEIYNEPLNTTSWNTVKNYAAPVIAAIRNKDSDNLIIVGTPTWSQDVHIAAQNPITGDPNLAYTLHFYANTHKQWLRDRALAAMNSGIALFVTEYGTTDASGDGGFNAQESQAWFDFMNNNNISYVNWTVSDKDEDSCIVTAGQGLQGLLNGDLTNSGAFVRAHMRGLTLSNDDFILNNESIKMYPNPVKNNLHINTVSNVDGITIYDMSGRLVFSESPQSNKKNLKIDLQFLSSGSYVLKLQSLGQNFATQIIKL